MRVQTKTIYWWMLFWGILFSQVFVSAQRSTHVRVYRPAGSHPANVTVSPTGSVLSRSFDSPSLLILDGYGRREIVVPTENVYRVYQSRSAQLWCVTKEGLQLYHAGQWSSHPIAEIRNELASNPIRQLRQITLLPAEVNHVFILLSDRLLDYNASTMQVGVLKMARDTRLGEFNEIQEGVAESLWISGTFGVAHVQGPGRRITPQTTWGEYILPDTNLVNTLQRPFEFPPGKLTVSANTAGEGSRFVVRLQEDQFSWFRIPGEKIKQSWTAWDETLWGYSATELFQILDAPEVRLRKEPVSGAQYDMACETNGVFWIASSEGVIRHAPFLWRPPPELESLQAAIYSMVFDRERSTLWCASPEGLIAIRDRKQETFQWPENVEGLIPPKDGIFVVGEGRVLVGTAGRPLLFDPGAKRFAPLPMTESAQVHLLGEMNDGSVCAWFEGDKKDEDAAADLRVFRDDKFERLELPSFSPGSRELLVTCESQRGDLWIGTSSGIIQVKRREGTVEFHGAEQKLFNQRISALAELSEGRIWCGSDSRLFEYNGQRWELRLNTPERVNSIRSIGGNIWIGTPVGIFRGLQDSWIFNGLNEGIPGGGVNALKESPEGRLWAATSRGLVVFHPDADRDAPRTLSPVVREPERPSTLEPTSVSFYGQDKWDYTGSSDLLYSYRLDEGGWSPFSNITSRVFQNLSSGSHLIEVRAMDRNGNQAPNISQLEFSVIVPWFKDPRLLAVSIFALCVSLVLAAYATLKHFQLKRSYAEVERIVKQRTRELERANQELLHSQKMRAIGTMAAGIAHDFNNILSIIKGSAQIIEGNVEDKEKIRTRVNRIQTVVEQGTAIVKSLLGLGRVNEQELNACDIGSLLQQTQKLLSDRFSDEVQFQVHADDPLPKATCSAEVLQQMLLNFILNAVESMGSRGVVSLSARLRTRLPSNLVLEPHPAEEFIVISVADHGSGIPSEDLPRIFEPFFTTKGFSSRRGTGLGLSMVYELAKGLGYGVSVETEVGKGSTFSIILPLRPRTTANPEP